MKPVELPAEKWEQIGFSAIIVLGEDGSKPVDDSKYGKKMEDRLVYMDYSSTTPVDQRVIEVMIPYFNRDFGNASSKTHAWGWTSEEAVEIARNQVAEGIGIDPGELIFTSGATESINLAIKGVFERFGKRGKHYISAKTEHRAVLDCMDWIEKMGGEVSWLPTDKKGGVNPDQLRNLIRPDTIMVSLMWGNNETGHLYPINSISKVCKDKGVLFFSDATQAVGKIPVFPREMGVDLLAFSAHKFYGPKGVGGLYVSSHNPRVKITPQIHGGGHQDDMRSGTLNVPGIVGMGAAIQLAQREMKNEAIVLKQYRDQLENELKKSLEGVVVNGDVDNRLPHISNLSFEMVRASDLLGKIGNCIALSSGSACTSGSGRPSHVLRTMGYSEDRASGGVRFSLGRYTTEEDVVFTVETIAELVGQLRKINPMWEILKNKK